MRKLKIGDTVRYSVPFLRSIGEITGEMPQAKGKITGFIPLGSIRLAVIDWDRNMPERVNENNLARPFTRGYQAD